jgi:hypothetical protein
MYDWEVFGIYAGNRLTEWAQRDGTNIILNIDESPNAFIISNIEFFGENRCRCSLQFALQHPHLIYTATVTWRFQKNGENGEKKTFVHAFDNPVLCAVSALLRIAQRWVDLNLPPMHPLNGRVQLIRESNINAALQSAAKTVYNITKQEELSHFTSHSIHVGACVALHLAGINPLDIKHALCWKSDSFLTCLRNLPCQAQRTSRAVTEFNPNRVDIIPGAAAA